MPIYASREKKNRKMKTNRHKKWVDSKSIKKNEGYEMVVYNIEMSIYNNNILWTKLIRKNRFIRTQAMQSQFWKKWMDSNNPTGIRVGKTVWNGLQRLGADLYFFSAKILNEVHFTNYLLKWVCFKIIYPVNMFFYYNALPWWTRFL